MRIRRPSQTLVRLVITSALLVASALQPVWAVQTSCKDARDELVHQVRDRLALPAEITPTLVSIKTVELLQQDSTQPGVRCSAKVKAAVPGSSSRTLEVVYRVMSLSISVPGNPEQTIDTFVLHIEQLKDTH